MGLQTIINVGDENASSVWEGPVVPMDRMDMSSNLGEARGDMRQVRMAEADRAGYSQDNEKKYTRVAGGEKPDINRNGHNCASGFRSSVL